MYGPERLAHKPLDRSVLGLDFGDGTEGAEGVNRRTPLTRRAYPLIQAPLVALALTALVVTGCNKQQNSAPPGSSGTKSVAAPATGASELLVTRTTTSGEMAIIEFNLPVSPTSISGGFVSYEDTDLDPGGTFRPGSAKPFLYPSGRVLVVLAGQRTPHEVRVQLTRALRGAQGEPLGRSGVGHAVSLLGPGPEPIFELRYRPVPLPLVGSTAPVTARNTTDDHGDDASDASPLVTVAAGAIQVAGDRDWFALLVRRDDRIRLRTVTSGDTILTLYSADGQILAINDDAPEGGVHSAIDHVSAQDGILYAEVRGYASTTPAYRIVRAGSTPPEPGDTPGDALPVALGQTLRTALGAEDADYYSLELSAGTELRCELDSPDLHLIATDGLGRAIAGEEHRIEAGETLGQIARDYGLDYRDIAALNGIPNPNRVPVGLVLTVPARSSLTLRAPGGRFFVRIAAGAGVRGPYELSFKGSATRPAPAPGADDHPDTSAGASPLSLGVAQSGAIEAAGDQDVFQVDLTAGTTYVLAVQTSGDSQLRLLDASGAEVADGGNGPASRLTYRPARSGPHFAEISADGAETLTYTVSVSELDERLPHPERFQPRTGTDPWHIDFRLRADLFTQDMAARGLNSGDAVLDRLARDRVIDQVLSFLSQKYKLDSGGAGIAGQSFKISFTAEAPAGRPGRNYSREVVGGTHQDGDGILGVSYLDLDNDSREDNDDLGRLGIFSASIEGRRSTLRPGLTPSDLRYLDGSYQLGAGSRSDDRRFERIRRTISDWAHALAVVTAHEVGHSVGLEHDESHGRGIMQAALSSSLLSDLDTRFADPSLTTLRDTLETD